jgi:predicted DNA-binding transcriptional regulator YafY
MPANKSALLRYRIIDSCLTNTRRRYPTLQDLKEKIEEQLMDNISESMLNKDFQAMKRIYNAPIKFSRTNGGYYYEEDGFSIKEFPLTHDEIDALDISTAFLQKLKGTRLFEQFENAINKVIEGYRISKMLGKSEKHILQVEQPAANNGSEWLESILKAIVNKQNLLVEYRPFNKEKKLHNFSAYLLKEYRNRWYAVGHSSVAKTILVLALDRLLSIKLSADTYVNSNEFDPDEFFKYSFGITQVHALKPERIILAFSTLQALYILSQPLHHSQKVLQQNDDEVQIELYVYVTEELKMMIRGYGRQVKVVEPKSLAEVI